MIFVYFYQTISIIKNLFLGDYFLNNSDYKITTGVGNHQMQTSQYITWMKPNQMISSGSLGVMGFEWFAKGTWF